MPTSLLTDAKCRNAKPDEKERKLPDGGGLYLHITPAGSKIWRWRYKLPGGTEKLLTIGHYPGIGLAEARTARDEANKIRREGHDPAVAKKLQKEERATRNTETFELVAREWHARNQDRWSDRHAADVIGSLDRDAFPAIGRLPMTARCISNGARSLLRFGLI